MPWLAENIVSSFGFDTTVLEHRQHTLDLYISIFLCSSIDPKLLLSKVLMYACTS